MRRSGPPNWNYRACGAASEAKASAAMPRRIAFLSLLCAWLCASGAMLDVAQGIAWAKMFAGYAGRESMAAAARDTFDPSRPCGLCLAVSAAREAASRHVPAVPGAGAEKLIMICQDTVSFVGVTPTREWREILARCRTRPAEDVPLPPPRTIVG
jgi:hypothetical protein